MTVAWLLALSVAIVLAAWIRNHPTWPAPQITKFLIYQIACLFVPLACSFFLFRANHNLFGWAALADHIRGLWLTTFSLGVHPNHLVGFIDSLINAVVLIAYALGCWHLQPRHHPRAILVAAFVVVLALWSCQDLLALLQTVDWSHWPKRIQPLMDDLLWGMAMWAALGCAEAALRGEAPFARALWSSSFLFTGLTQAGLDIVDPGRQGRNEWLFTILGSSRMLVVYSLIYAALTMDLYGKRLGIKTLLVVLVGLEASLGLPLLYDSPAHWVWLVYLVLMPASFGFFAYVYFTAYKATGDLEIQARLREEQARLDFDAQTIQELEARRAALEEENMALEQQAMKLRSATETKSQFLANMAHELRTPLNGILGFADVLANTMAEELSAEEREWAQEVLQEGEKLLGLINAVLDLAKCEAGAMVMRPQEVDLEALLREIGAGPLLAGRLQVHVTGEQPVLVWADAGRIRQALEMILGYYARYAKGYIPLDVNSTSGMVNLEIALALAVTVEPFYPGPDGKAPEGAAALALALGKALIEGHGGRMRVLYGRLRCRMVGVGVQEQDDVHRRLA
jgi:signal transduction histidine kinase